MDKLSYLREEIIFKLDIICIILLFGMDIPIILCWTAIALAIVDRCFYAYNLFGISNK